MGDVLSKDCGTMASSCLSYFLAEKGVSLPYYVLSSRNLKPKILPNDGLHSLNLRAKNKPAPYAIYLSCVFVILTLS